eukprot:PITA_07331
MPSRHKYHLIKVKEEEDHMLEEEEQAHTEVEKESLQARMEEETIKIQVKAQAKIKNKVRDSGCSNHMIGNIEMFFDLDESVKCGVTLGTDRKVFVMGKGRVNILTKKGEEKYISDFYFVPGLKYNLMSLGQLMQKGYNVFFKNDVCTILDSPPRRQLIAKV